MRKTLITCLSLLLTSLVASVDAKLANTPEQNLSQYGQPTKLEKFPQSASFTGYATYDINDDWKLKAFFNKGKVRSEHLLPKSSKTKTLSRSDVRNWAAKMFSPRHRGRYRGEVKRHLVEGHFFDKGLIAYECNIEGHKKKGYKGVKVLFFENNQSYYAINPKAYL